MEEIYVKFYRMDSDVKLPRRVYINDACWDVYSNMDLMIRGREKKLVSTGLKVAIPPGWELQIRPRSGLAVKERIIVLNTPGTIDSGYLGEIKIILYKMPPFNMSKIYEPTYIKKGDRIAQMALKPVYNMKLLEVATEEMLGETDRGEGGFGSTGN
jgi:dUTP pyrophosphatase